MTKRKYVATVLAIVLCGCGPSTTTESPQRTEAESVQEIEASLTEYGAAMSAMDWDTVVRFYADDSRFFWVEDGSVRYDSKAAVEGALRGIGTSIESLTMTISDRNITVLSDDVAHVAATYVQNMVLEGGREFSLAGAFTIVLKRQDGVWKFLIGHSSTVRERGY